MQASGLGEEVAGGGVDVHPEGGEQGDPCRGSPACSDDKSRLTGEGRQLGLGPQEARRLLHKQDIWGACSQDPDDGGPIVA